MSTRSENIDENYKKLKIFKTLGLSLSIIFKNKKFYSCILLMSLIALVGFTFILYFTLSHIIFTMLGAVANHVFERHGFTLIYSLIFYLIQAFTIYGTMQILQQIPTSLWQSFVYGLKRFLSVIGVVLILFLCWAIVTFLKSAFVSASDSLERMGGPFAASGLVVLILICLVFFRLLTLFNMFYITIPICVYEKLGPIASLRRAHYLVSGSNYRGQIFGIALIAGLILAVFTISFDIILPGLISSFIGTMLYSYTIATVISIFSMVVPVVVYFRLRQIKDKIFLGS